MKEAPKEAMPCVTCKTLDHVKPYTDPVNGKRIDLCTSERCAVEYFANTHPNPRTIPQKALHEINMILWKLKVDNERLKQWL